MLRFLSSRYTEESNFHKFGSEVMEVTKRYKSDQNRFQKISFREDKSVLTIEAIKTQCKGRNFITHKGVPVLKSPDDMIIIQQVLWDLRPATVIELGTFLGGSAIWLADMLRLMEIPSQVLSMDIDLSLISEHARNIKPNNVTFLQGDSNVVQKTFTNDLLQGLPHPWLVIDDAHTNVYGVMKYFHGYMQTGDYFIMEDLNPNIPQLGYGRIFSGPYKKVGDNGLIMLKAFLTDYSQYYSVDSFYTDFFGYNGTWNWHGFICKMQH